MCVLNFIDIKTFVNISTPLVINCLQEMKGEIMGILMRSVELYLLLWSI